MKPATKNIFRSLLSLMLLSSAFITVCPGAEIPAHKFMVTAGANFFHGSSSDYREIYGQAVFLPEIKLTCLVYKNFSVWGGLGLISKQGFIEEVAETTEIKQAFLSLGIGYAHKLSAKLRLRGELGLAAISYKEEALGGTQKGSGLGWKLGADLDYFLSKKLFLFLTAAYSQASDETEIGKVKLGGAQGGIGVGIAF